MTGRHILKVDILDGRGFGQDVQALVCSATFAGETKTSTYSVAGDCHVWNSTLLWGLDKDQLRKLQSSGVSNCKLTVLRKDGVRLGWVVLDLRTAKLQHQYKKDPAGTSVVGQTQHHCVQTQSKHQAASGADPEGTQKLGRSPV